jgi:hypothetical protein
MPAHTVPARVDVRRVLISLIAHGFLGDDGTAEPRRKKGREGKGEGREGKRFELFRDCAQQPMV